MTEQLFELMFNLDKLMFLLIRVENISLKGEIGYYEQFLLLQQWFQNLSICWNGLKKIVFSDKWLGQLSLILV